MDATEACRPRAPDAEVVERVRRRRDRALRGAHAAVQPEALPRRPIRLPRDAAEAEDVVQDAWVRAFAAPDAVRGPGEPARRGWCGSRCTRPGRARGGAAGPGPGPRRTERRATWNPRCPSPTRRTTPRPIEMRDDPGGRRWRRSPRAYRTVFVLRSIEDHVHRGDGREPRSHSRRRQDAAPPGARPPPEGSSWPGPAPPRPPSTTFAGARCDRIVAAVLARVGNRASGLRLRHFHHPLRGLSPRQLIWRIREGRD